MTQTTINQRTVMTGKPMGLTSAPVKAGAVLPHGTMSFFDATTGELDNTPAAGANLFAGVMHEAADNSDGAVGGEIDGIFYAYENRFELPFNTDIAQANVGDKVFAQDNYGLSLDPTNATYVGKLEKFINTRKGVVKPEFAAQDAVV